MSAPTSLIVATHNVLADDYIKPEYYPRSDPEDFLPVNRHPRLVAYEAALGADVLLLQEVDHAMFKRLDRRLRPAGSVGRWAHKGFGKPDGCATFVRAPFRVATWLVLDLEDAARSGHVALAAVIKLGSAMLTVVNAHLKWDKPDATGKDRYGHAQALHLLQVLANQPHTIVGMDANAEPGSDLLAAFGDAGFVDPHPASHSTFVMNGRPRKIDYLLHTRDLTGIPLLTASLSPDSVLPSKTDPSDHLPLFARFAPTP